MLRFIYGDEDADDLLRAFGIKAAHNQPLDPGFPFSRKPDFTFTLNGKTYYWEHMGKLADPVYHQDQIQKLKEYRARNIRFGENLIITAPINYKNVSYLHVARLLWQLVRLDIIPARKALKLYFRDKK